MTRYDDPMFRTSLSLSTLERDQLDLAGELADLDAEIRLHDCAATQRQALDAAMLELAGIFARSRLAARQGNRI